MLTGCLLTYMGPGKISIARAAPRGMSGFRIYRALAPGRWFNSVSREEYEQLYFSEILGRLDPAQVVKDLERLAGGAEPVLCCWERPPLHAKNWCHREMVAKWFEDRLGLVVEEYDPKRHSPLAKRRTDQGALDLPPP